METTNNGLAIRSKEETIIKIERSIKMSLAYEKQINVNIFCNDFQKISNAILESINQTDKEISFYMCQCPAINYPIDFLLNTNGNLESLENYFNECWSKKSMFKYGLEWYLFNNKTKDFDKVSALDTKKNNAVLLVRDANTFDLNSQHNFLYSEKLVVIFQSRDDMKFLNRNFDTSTSNQFKHFKME